MQVKQTTRTEIGHIPLRYHIIFWIIYFLFNFIRYGSLNNDYWYSFKSNLVEFPLNIIITYFTIYYLIPKYIITKKYTQFIIYLSISILVFYVIRTELSLWLVTDNIWPEAEGSDKAYTFNHFIAHLIGVIYVIGFVSAIKFTIDWMYERKRNDELRELQLQTELRFLRTQIQPHFFFNTLNNLYALTIEQSDKAPNVVLKLSEIMKYVLYEVKGSKVGLLKEISYIQSYLELEKLRFGNLITTHIDISGDIDDIEVPPLLFITFIENCFKHGTFENNNMNIKIEFKIKDQNLLFKVCNTISDSYTPNDNEGIGIKNIERRLQLLYKDNYSLKKYIKNNTFIVELKIPVA